MQLIFLAFVIPKTIWGNLLVQPILPEYQFYHGGTTTFYPEGELYSKVELIVSIFEGI